jgi:hypothetical protein
MPAQSPLTHTDLLALPKVDLYRRLGGAFDLGSLSSLLGRDADAGQPGGSQATAHGSESGARLDLDAAEVWMTQVESRLLAADALGAAVGAVAERARDERVARLELAVSSEALAEGAGSVAAGLDRLSEAMQMRPADEMPSIGWLIGIAANGRAGDLQDTLGPVLERRADSGVIGLVLRGASTGFAGRSEALTDARQAGLPLVVRLAPDLDLDSHVEDLERLDPERIVFGSALLHNLQALGWIRERRPVLVACLSVEKALGMWPKNGVHPLIQIIQAGMRVGLGSWAPALVGRRLTDDYRLASDGLDLSLESLRGLTLAGVQASFLDKRSKLRLEREFEAAIFGLPTEN